MEDDEDLDSFLSILFSTDGSMIEEKPTMNRWSKGTRGFSNGDMFRESGKIYIHFGGTFYNIASKRPSPSKVSSHKKALPRKDFVGNVAKMVRSAVGRGS